MSIKARIKELAAARNLSIAELERKLDFANGSISKWDKQSPSAERLQKVAEYFEVSSDYLLGRENNSDLFYRINTTGLNADEVNDMREQLDDYTDFLRMQIQKNRKK